MNAITKQVDLWEATAEAHRDAMRAALTTKEGSTDESLARAADSVVTALKDYAVEMPFMAMPDDPDRVASAMTNMRLSFGELRAIETALTTFPDAPASAIDWRAVARDLAGALSGCTHQIDQMRGMFDDKDGTIAEALEDAETAAATHAAAVSASLAAPADPRIVVIMEGGICQGVVSDDAGMIGRTFYVVDYDIDGSEQTVAIPQGDGKTQRAAVSSELIGASKIDFAAISPAAA